MKKMIPRQARQLAGFETMSDMARAMDMPLSTYMNKETGRSTFTIKEAIVFARKCGLEFSDIDFLWAERPEIDGQKGDDYEADAHSGGDPELPIHDED